MKHEKRECARRALVRQGGPGVLAVFLVAAASAQDPRQEMLHTDFSSLDTSEWVCKGQDAQVRDGKLIIWPQRGQQYLTTRKSFLHATLEMSVRFHVLSRDSTVFYYLGFQSLAPWVRDVCWVQIQDAAVTAVLKKNGQTGFRKHVGYVTQGRDRVFKLEWEPAGMRCSLDGRELLSPDQLRVGLSSASTAGAVVPNRPLPLFLGAYGTAPDKARAKLQVNWVRISYPRLRKRKERASTEKERVILGQRRSWGDRVTGEFVLEGGRLRCENVSALFELNLRGGPSWGRFFHKDTKTEGLHEQNNTPVFAVLEGADLFDSTTFALDAIRSRTAHGKQALDLELANRTAGLTAVLSITPAERDALRLGLRVTNAAATARVLQVAFPLVGRLKIGDDLAENRYFFPWRTGLEGQVDCSLAAEYGGLAWMQVIAAYSPARASGVCVYPEDNLGRPKGIVFRKESPAKEGYVRFSEVTLHREAPSRELLDFQEGMGLGYYYLRRTLAPGASFSPPSAIVRLYRGTWREALRDYSRWAHTWYRHVPTPQWLKDCYTFIPLHAPGFYSEKRRKYVAAEDLRGGEHIQQWAYWDDHVEIPPEKREFALQGMQAGDFQYHRARGGLDTFRDEIHRIQRKGTRHSVYIDHRFCWRETQTAKRHCPAWAARYSPGRYGYYSKPGDQWMMSFYEKSEWAGYIAEVCARLIRDTGMDCVYLDELGIAFPDYSPEKSALREDGLPVSTRLLAQCIANVREAMVAENPEAALMCEHAGSDWLSQFFDGSWAQTFYTGAFDFAEKHYDDNSLLYFRFCFPEFKLAEWGESNDGPRRCLFNGVGIDWNNFRQPWNKDEREYLIRTGQVFRECGDAFATLEPEPLVPTLVAGVLANRFPGKEKVAFTLYNKNSNPTTGPVIDVPARGDCHYVELVGDLLVASTPAAGDKHRLAPRLPAQDVICVAQLPRRLRAQWHGRRLTVQVSGVAKGLRLCAFLDRDDSHLHEHRGQDIDLASGRGTLSLPEAVGRERKVILKLFRGHYLVDEVVIGDRESAPEP